MHNEQLLIIINAKKTTILNTLVMTTMMSDAEIENSKNGKCKFSISYITMSAGHDILMMR